MYHPSPNLLQCLYSPQRIAAVVDVLAEDGISASRVLGGANLRSSDLRDSAVRVSYQQVETVFRNAMRLSQDPAIAFRAGERMHVMAYGMYGYAMLSSPTRAEVIDFAAKYGRILGTVADIGFSRKDDTASYLLDPLLSRDPADDVYRFALEFAFATYQTLSRDVYGGSFRFSKLSAAYAAPPHAETYDRIFQCPVEFDQRKNVLEFDAAWIDHPAVCPDETTKVMAGRMYDQLLDHVEQDDGLAADIRRRLVEHPGRFPSIEAMAATLSIHPRTLRRRLQLQQRTYRQIVSEVRMQLAVGYLRNTQMTNDEIAARLDYSDAANFRHAFVRWTGKSPSDFRNGGASRVAARAQDSLADVPN
ncbi:AraC family transcriptional regulator ligand-binding domain-containing protein [Bradyrhizobium erythrophlei]|uniref:AraC family transcriptional regulator n=1 Tax=Bradyrhizobium erythrophlei TaxID=1437360 RepID=UPI0035F08FDF